MSTTTCARAGDDDGEEEGAETGEDVALGRLSDDAINASLSPSIYALARAIKKSAHGAFHCAHSIAVDAAFGVRESGGECRLAVDVESTTTPTPLREG